MTPDDLTLLREFAANRSEPAFAALVERHVALVHSAALRQTGDVHLAEEITQAVFIILARKAAMLGKNTILPAWLYRTTRYAASNALKIQHRRRVREEEAFMQSTLERGDAAASPDDTDVAWQQVAPLLDDVMDDLSEQDRAAVVLRYFENCPWREVAALTRVTEDTAQKRVTRALEKLRKLFAKRRVTLTAALIAGAVSANSVQAAPQTLAKTISAVALMKGATTTASTLALVKGVMKTMTWLKLQFATSVAIVALALSGTVAAVVTKTETKGLKGTPATSAPVTLPDGSTIRIVGVTYGTNHVLGSTLAQSVARFPLPARIILNRVLGTKALPTQQIATQTTNLVVWIDRETNGPAISTSTSYFEVALGDTTGFVSGDSEMINSPAYFSSVEPIKFKVLPRRSREITLNVYARQNNGQASNCCTLSFANPVYGKFPQWNPESLPATKRVGDLEFTLVNLETGHGSHTSTSRLPGSRLKTVSDSNMTDGRNRTSGDFRFKPSNTNEAWVVTGVEVSDVTGNLAQNNEMGWGGNGNKGTFTFRPGLWPDEAAWKLKLELKRTMGFRPEEIFAFKNVPLGEIGRTNTLAWATNVAGIRVTLQSFARRPVAGESWSSDDLSELKLTHTSLPDGTHLDLISAISDTGQTNSFPSSSSGSDEREYGFTDIQTNAQTADFYFAIHQSRTVEFTVKPELPKSKAKTKKQPGQNQRSKEVPNPISR